MKVSIFGATGRTGRHLVEQALAAGYEVVAFARTPAKVGVEHERLTIVQGDVTDGVAVETAVAGADAVISVLGPTSNTPEYKVSQGMERILAAMKKHKVRRLVVSAGAGVADAGDAPRLLNHLIGFLVKVFSRYVYEDMKRTVDIVRASGVDWTIVRVPMLTDQPGTGNVRVGYVGKGTGPRLSRVDMADFMLRQVEDDSYRHKAPVISN